MGKAKAETESTGYDRIIKYTGVFGGVQTLTNLITLVKSKLVAHFIGPAGMGIAYAFNRALDLVGKTTDLGISFSAVKTISEAMEEEDGGRGVERQLVIVRSWCLWLGVIGTVACFLLAPLFSALSFDGDYGYTLSFRLLSVVVGATAVTGAERAILKGTHLLKQLAMNQIWVVLATLLVATPLYMWLGMQGIVPVLVCTSLATMVLTCWYSFRAFPYRVRLFSREVLREGNYIVRLGINYTLAGFLGAGVLFLVSAYMLKYGMAEEVGYYSNAVILSSYLSMLVFSAVETDFFPRLSAVNRDGEASRALVNEQTEVLVLLIAPLIALFILFLPVIIVVLLKPSFLPMVEVTQWAALALFFTALTRPMSFMALSKGDSLTYLVQELLYDGFMAASVILGYHYGGLRWTGIALLASSVFDWVINLIITHVRYGFRPSRRVNGFAALFGILLALFPLCNALMEGHARIAAEVLAAVATTALSLFFLYRQTDFLQNLAAKIKR